MRWLAIAGIGAVVLGVGIGAYFMTRPPDVDLENPPQFIQAEFIELAKIGSISKFRSGAGHDFSGSGETCRSMKHYVRPIYDPTNPDAYPKGGNDILPPPPTPATEIAIFSPVDGVIEDVSDEQTPIGQQIRIKPATAPQFRVRLFHIYLDAGVGRGTKVTAGQRIGAIAKGAGTDIAIQAGPMPWQETFVSYFAVMPDSLFAGYLARGVTSRDELIISRADRDAHPLTCEGETFIYPEGYDHEADDVRLSGYVDGRYAQGPVSGSSATAGSDDSSAEPSAGTLDQGLPPNDADAGFPPAASNSGDTPPLLLKSIGFNLDTYDPATGRAGDFQFTKQKLQFDRLLMGYGFHIDASGASAAKDNPQPTFILPLGTKVRSLVDGVVTEIPTLYSGDVSIQVTDGKNEQWRYETEHVISPVVKVGDRVTAGQEIAEVSDYDTGLPSGLGLFEIGILHGGQTPEHVCPFAYLDPSIKADIQSKLLQFYKDWESYKGDDSLYNESESPTGCLTTSAIEG